MNVLGAILAGGQSRRFGSDKALAVIESRTLLDHVCERLAPQVRDFVICGRSYSSRRWIPDRPEPGLGPLGGLCAALAEAAARGFQAVVTAPVDVHPVPGDLVIRLQGELQGQLQGELQGQAPCTLRSQHLLGYWPAELSPLLDDHLRAGNRSVRSWIELTGARQIDDREWGLRNINRASDMPPG